MSAANAHSQRPTTVLIGALGGEGGGVLSNWIVDAAQAAGLWVQATSVPGVAQRTGATTYYVEMGAHPSDQGSPGSNTSDQGSPGSDEEKADFTPPVMALLPSPGNVDLVVASELLEAGRAAHNGMVTPERTTVIASTHRLFSIAEKSAMGDGRFDTERIIKTVRALSKQAVLGDLSGVAKGAGSVISSAIFGAIAATGVIPVPREVMQGAIKRGGIAVEVNLRGFDAGYEFAREALRTGASREVASEVASGVMSPAGSPRLTKEASATVPVAFGALEARVCALPASVIDVVQLGLGRTRDYQNDAYALRYLEQVERQVRTEQEQAGAGREFALTQEVARYLALWMTYEDVIRVADLKIRPARMARVRAEIHASDGQPVVITEFLKPGLDEWCALLPRFVAEPLRRRLIALGWAERLSIGLHVKSTSIGGFFALWSLAKLRWWRPYSARFAEEHELIEGWLERIGWSLERDYDLALEVAACANLVKGYGDTHARGRGNFDQIMASLQACANLGSPAQSVKELREAALADPDGASLASAFAALGASR